MICIFDKDWLNEKAANLAWPSLLWTLSTEPTSYLLILQPIIYGRNQCIIYNHSNQYLCILVLLIMSHKDRIVEEGINVINEPEMKLEAGPAGVDWGAGREVNCDPWMKTENQQEYKVAMDTRRVNRWVTSDQWRYQLGDKRLPRVITFCSSQGCIFAQNRIYLPPPPFFKNDIFPLFLVFFQLFLLIFLFSWKNIILFPKPTNFSYFCQPSPPRGGGQNEKYTPLVPVEKIIFCMINDFPMKSPFLSGPN